MKINHLCIIILLLSILFIASCYINDMNEMVIEDSSSLRWVENGETGLISTDLYNEMSPQILAVPETVSSLQGGMILFYSSDQPNEQTTSVLENDFNLYFCYKPMGKQHFDKPQSADALFPGINNLEFSNNPWYTVIMDQGAPLVYFSTDADTRATPDEKYTLYVADTTGYYPLEFPDYIVTDPAQPPEYELPEQVAPPYSGRILGHLIVEQPKQVDTGTPSGEVMELLIIFVHQDFNEGRVLAYIINTQESISKVWKIETIPLPQDTVSAHLFNPSHLLGLDLNITALILALPYEKGNIDFAFAPLSEDQNTMVRLSSLSTPGKDITPFIGPDFNIYFASDFYNDTMDLFRWNNKFANQNLPFDKIQGAVQPDLPKVGVENFEITYLSFDTSPGETMFVQADGLIDTNIPFETELMENTFVEVSLQAAGNTFNLLDSTSIYQDEVIPSRFYIYFYKEINLFDLGIPVLNIVNFLQGDNQVRLEIVVKDTWGVEHTFIRQINTTEIVHIQ